MEEEERKRAWDIENPPSWPRTFSLSSSLPFSSLWVRYEGQFGLLRARMLNEARGSERNVPSWTLWKKEEEEDF